MGPDSPIAARLKAWFKGKKGACPMCASKEFTVGNEMVALTVVEPHATEPLRVDAKGTIAACYFATCRSCGMVLLFDRGSVEGSPWWK